MYIVKFIDGTKVWCECIEEAEELLFGSMDAYTITLDIELSDILDEYFN